MKLFGRKGDTLYVAVLIILILLISCVGFGYCLSFSYREGNRGKLANERQNNFHDDVINTNANPANNRQGMFKYDLDAIDIENDNFLKKFSSPPGTSNLNENNYLKKYL